MLRLCIGVIMHLCEKCSSYYQQKHITARDIFLDLFSPVEALYTEYGRKLLKDGDVDDLTYRRIKNAQQGIKRDVLALTISRLSPQKYTSVKHSISSKIMDHFTDGYNTALFRYALIALASSYNKEYLNLQNGSVVTIQSLIDRADEDFDDFFSSIVLYTAVHIDNGVYTRNSGQTKLLKDEIDSFLGQCRAKMNKGQNIIEKHTLRNNIEMAYKYEDYYKMIKSNEFKHRVNNYLDSFNQGHRPTAQEYRAYIDKLSYSYHSKKVLWVDDHPENNKSGHIIFERAGIEVIDATSTKQAIDFLNDNPVSLIISDMKRIEGQMEGHKLLHDIRHAGNETPFLIFEGEKKAGDVEKTFALGGQGHTNNMEELFLIAEVFLHTRFR